MASKFNKMGVFSIAMLNVALVMSLRGLPLMAKEGLGMIFYLLFAALLFLLPAALVSAELATGWTKEGGVYRWVKEAFGSKWGFTAIWLQWLQNTIWYPTILAFAAGALAYLFVDPALAQNRLFNVVVILVIYWSATLLNFRGVKTASWLTTFGVIAGTIIPAIFIILLGFVWLFMGKPLEFLQNPKPFLPDLANLDSLAFLGGFVLFFAGIEVGAVHVLDMKNPKTGYPKSIFIAIIIIFATFLLGSLAIGSVIPYASISLTAGIMQGFKDLLHLFALDWILPFIGFLIAFGAIGGVTAWIGGPSKGLLATAKSGDLPPFLQHINKHGVQTHILMVQGLIVTILAFAFLFMPTVSSAYFLLTDLTASLYLVMYILMYLAAIRLKYSAAKVKRSYEVPGGKLGMWIVAGIGFLAAVFAFIVSFFPPKQFKMDGTEFYVSFIAIGVIIFVGAPLLINHFKNPKWLPKKRKKR